MDLSSSLTGKDTKTVPTFSSSLQSSIFDCENCMLRVERLPKTPEMSIADPPPGGYRLRTAAPGYNCYIIQKKKKKIQHYSETC